MTRCPNCNAKVDTSFVTHCMDCGTFVAYLDQSGPEAEQPSGNQEPAPPPAAAMGGFGRFMRGIGLRVLVVAVILGGVAIWSGRENADRGQSGAITAAGVIDAFDLTVGDCIDLPDSEADEFSSVRGMPCGEPHDAEVFAVITYPADGAAPWPGNDTIVDYSVNACHAEFARYVGLPYEQEPDLDFNFFTPTEAGWIDEGDRIVQCVVYRLDTAKLTTTVRAAA